MTPLQTIERDKLFTFKAPTEELTQQGVERIETWLRDNYNLYVILDTVVGSKQNMTIEYDDYTLRGRLFSRIEQYLHHRHDIELDDRRSQQLGLLIAQNMLGGSEISFFDVVDFIRWRPGSFGEKSNSCWWSFYRNGKRLFINEMERGEATAIRLFRPATFAEQNQKGLKKWYGSYVGVGRCFATVDNPVGADIIFNTYGLDADQWTLLLMSVLGYEHSQPIHFNLNPQTFINRAAGVALSMSPMDFPKSMYRDNDFGRYAPTLCKDCGAKFRARPDSALVYRQQCYTCYEKERQLNNETAVRTL